MSTTPRKRVRARPRDSIENDDDDRVLDAMLLELGIPPTQTNTSIRSPTASVEVIELITPPPPPAKKSKQNDGPLIVDLTISPSTSVPSPSPSNGNFHHPATPPFSPSSESENSFSESSLSELLSPNTQLSTQIGTKQARRLSERLRDFHSETRRSNSERRQDNERTNGNPAADTVSTHLRGKSKTKVSSASGVDKAPVVVVQMETSLDTSRAGQSIRDALKNHVYNGKPVPFILANALTCTFPGIIRWELQENSTSHCLCAIYYEATEFLRLIVQTSYHEVVTAVQYLETLVPTVRDRNENSFLLANEQDAAKFFVIVEGMDHALIELQNEQKKTKSATLNCDSRMITFADLQEVAFQLFLDVGAHTKFTSDLEATATYVALLTRELMVSSSRASALEEVLEAVPRYNSVRVTQSGDMASPSANAWLRMLQVIPGVSEDKAQCLLDHFPTFASLMQAYRNPNLSHAQKQDLVADKLHEARIERTLSKRIYTVFCEENPDALI